MNWDLRGTGPEIRILTAVLGPNEGRVAELISGTPGHKVTRRCADAAELLAVAHIGLGAVAVISADLPGLDRRMVQLLATDRVGLVVLNEHDDQFSAQRLGALGITEALSFADVDRYLLDAIGRAHAKVAPEQSPSFDLDASVLVPPPPPDLPRGKVITVWGTGGAPGRTTVAINLAYALAMGAGSDPKVAKRRSKRGIQLTGDQGTLLIDADTHAPSITQALGLLDESSGLAQVCHSADHGLLTTETLKSSYAALASNLDLLTGLPRVTRWPEITGSALEAVYYHARLSHEWVVVDSSAPTESDEILSFDTRAPQRNGATLTSAQASDCVIVVGRADPVGLKRLVDALTEVQENPVFHGAAVVVIVNQVRSGGAGPAAKATISDMLAQFCQIFEPIFLPYDLAVLDRAMMLGKALVDEAPGSAFAKQIFALAGLLHAKLGLREQVPELAMGSPIELRA